MRPILVAAARIDNLPKEADCRFCVKLRQRQARNLLRDAHRSERVKKQVVQFHLSLLLKRNLLRLKTLSEGVLEFWISLLLEKQPGSLVSFFGFSAVIAERGKKKKTPPVALVGAVAALLEPPLENVASRRTASVLTWSRMFVDILG